MDKEQAKELAKSRSEEADKLDAMAQSTNNKGLEIILKSAASCSRSSAIVFRQLAKYL